MALLGLIYFFTYFHRAAVPGTIFNELQREWNLSASAVVALGSVTLWVYGLMMLVAGILIDRFGGVRMFLLGSTIDAIAATLFPLIPNPAGLYACRAVMAVGDSFVYLGIAKEVSLLFPRERFARLLGVMQFCGGLGGVMAMLPFERAAHTFGWHASLFTMGCLMLATVGLSYFVLPRLKHFTPVNDAWTLRPLLDIICDRRVRPLLIVSAINFPIYFTLQIGIGKKFIQDFAGLSSKQGATFTLIMMSVCALVSLASGYVLEHIGGRRKTMLYFGCGSILFAQVLLLAGLGLPVGPGIFLTGYILLAMSNLAAPIAGVVMKELNDERHVSQALALQNTLAYFGVALGLTISGTVLDLFHASATPTSNGLVYPTAAYATVFLILAGLAVISLVSTRSVSETRDQ